MGEWVKAIAVVIVLQYDVDAHRPLLIVGSAHHTSILQEYVALN